MVHYTIFGLLSNEWKQQMDRKLKAASLSALPHSANVAAVYLYLRLFACAVPRPLWMRLRAAVPANHVSTTCLSPADPSPLSKAAGVNSSHKDGPRIARCSHSAQTLWWALDPQQTLVSHYKDLYCLQQSRADACKRHFHLAEGLNIWLRTGMVYTCIQTGL